MNALSPRAFLHRLITAFVVAVVLTTVAIVGAYAEAAKQGLARSRRSHIDTSVLAAGGNYLLIGSDSRAFVDNPQEAPHFGSAQQQTGQRSDTIMVAHIDDQDRHRAPGVVPARPVGRDPGHRARQDQRRVQRRAAARDRDDRERLRHPDQSLPRGRLRGLPQDGEHASGRSRSTSRRRPATRRAASTINHGRLSAAQRRPGARVRAVALLRVVRQRRSGSRIPPPISAGSSASSTSCARSRSRRCTPRPRRRGRRATCSTRCSTNLQRDPKLGLSSLRALAYAFHQPGGVETQTLPVNRQFIDGQDALVLDDAKAAPLLRAAARHRQPVGRWSSRSSSVDPRTVHVAVENGSGHTGLGARANDALGGLGFSGRRVGDERRPQRLLGHRGPLRARARRPRRSSCSRELGGAGKVVALGRERTRRRRHRAGAGPRLQRPDPGPRRKPHDRPGCDHDRGPRAASAARRDLRHTLAASGLLSC